VARHIWAGLDGLRGIAVLAVVVFHGSLGWSVNGYVGVDVFFCLSGFLITKLLLDEHERTQSVDLRAFYLRRVLRLFPALVATTIGVLALGVAIGEPGRVAPGALAALAYYANWWLYTGHSALLLEHTWTLSLEEHFYFVWPLLLVLMLSRSRARRLLGGGGVVLLLALMTLHWPAGIDAVRASYLRGAPIVWGCLLALALHRWRSGPDSARTQRLAGLAAMPALLLLLVIMVVPDRLPARWMTGVTSIPGLLAVLVVTGVVLAPGSRVAGALSWPALTWVGRRSYGLYLYHFPIISVFLHQVPYPAGRTGRAAAGMALSVLVAAASYRWLEQPFLRLKSLIADRSVPTSSGPGTDGALGAPVSP
jgi:peptidoglycan/LPS O-acetylase OafA/YrhL